MCGGDSGGEEGVKRGQWRRVGCGEWIEGREEVREDSRDARRVGSGEAEGGSR